MSEPKEWFLYMHSTEPDGLVVSNKIEPNLEGQEPHITRTKVIEKSMYDRLKTQLVEAINRAVQAEQERDAAIIQTTEMRKACEHYPELVDKALVERDTLAAAIEQLNKKHAEWVFNREREIAKLNMELSVTRALSPTMKTKITSLQSKDSYDLVFAKQKIDQLTEERNQLKAELEELKFWSCNEGSKHQVTLERLTAWHTEAKRLAEVLEPFSGRDGYEEVNQALAEHKALKESLNEN